MSETEAAQPETAQRRKEARHAHPSEEEGSPLTQMRRSLLSESAVYGVILVSSLIIVTGEKSDASVEVLLRVLGTVIVFWIAHVFAAFIADIGGSAASGDSAWSILQHGVQHSMGLLVAALVPLAVIFLGALGILSHDTAVWTALWVDVGLLAFLGFIAVARRTKLWLPRLGGAAGAALLGIAIMALKAFIH